MSDHYDVRRAPSVGMCACVDHLLPRLPVFGGARAGGAGAVAALIPPLRNCQQQELWLMGLATISLDVLHRRNDANAQVYAQARHSAGDRPDDLVDERGRRERPVEDQGPAVKRGQLERCAAAAPHAACTACLLLLLLPAACDDRPVPARRPRCCTLREKA